ncbi:MAG: outer membrane lipoprotein-sorting protein [Gammaproteobacteria bacterium]|nr:outer membrane lipoprotein-sorting protein [Gammaproteobacteria bacterium]
MKKFILLTACLILPALTCAQTAEEKGLFIAIEADKHDTGWKDQSSNLRMTLHNRQGQESFREMHNQALEVEGDGDKTLIVFDLPQDVKGTAFLSFTHATRPDDQWLFLPALKRVKRISSSNKSGPFMGSEFAYEDISSQEIDKYTYKYLKDDTIDGNDTFVIERFPQYENSGYTRQIVWLDKIKYQPLKIDFYDRKNSLLKTLSYHDYKQYLDKFWRPGKMQMTNNQNGKSTTLIWKDYKFNNNFNDRDFDNNSLQRAR